ncbi:MAG: hypothetical protein ABI882_10520, partial [Acidobacteriota bacterium]
ISPVSIPTVAPDLKRFMTSITKEQVKDSPGWDTDKPVSRQYETLFADYYKFPYYLGGLPMLGYASYPARAVGTAGSLPQPSETIADVKAEIEQSHLRSTGGSTATCTNLVAEL